MADVDITKQSLTPYIIVSIITVILLIAWALYLVHANNNNIFPFTGFTPPEGDEWVYPKGTSSAPLSAEQLALVQQLLAEGIADADESISKNKIPPPYQ